jgi:Leucine-rich repeat (LRR) protein
MKMMLHKYFTIIPFLVMTFFMVNKTYSAEVLTDLSGDTHTGFHSFHSPSIAVYAHELPAKDVRSIIIQLDDISIESLDDDLSVLAKTSYSLDLSCRSDLTHEHLRKVVHIPLVTGLDLAQTYLDNEGLRIISDMSLRFLDITDNRFDDAGMSSIALLKQLEELKVGSNKITSKGVINLPGLNRLRILDVGCTYLKNAGIQALSDCSKLEELNVEACGFDDAALDYFLGMPTLRSLNITGNKGITSGGIQRFFAQKRSDLVVLYDQ